MGGLGFLYIIVLPTLFAILLTPGIAAKVAWNAFWDMIQRKPLY